MSNIGNSFVQAFPGTGSLSRSAVNNASGVRTPLGGVYTGEFRSWLPQIDRCTCLPLGVGASKAEKDRSKVSCEPFPGAELRRRYETRAEDPLPSLSLNNKISCARVKVSVFFIRYSRFRCIGNFSSAVPHPVLQLHPTCDPRGDHYRRGHLHGRSQSGEADVEDEK